jgi:hypothetical protein
MTTWEDQWEAARAQREHSSRWLADALAEYFRATQADDLETFAAFVDRRAPELTSPVLRDRIERRTGRAIRDLMVEAGLWPIKLRQGRAVWNDQQAAALGLTIDDLRARAGE